MIWKVLILFAAVASGATGMASVPLDEAWRLASIYRFEEARAAFAALEGREARLGEATALLNVQPKTEYNIQRAADLLDAVAATDPRDSLGLNARYLRARIEDVHRFQPDSREAARLYRALLQDAPSGHLLAEQAAVALALLELFGGIAEGAPLERLGRAEALGAGLESGEARRDFHLMLGRAWLYFDQDRARALEHFEAAWSAGILNFTNRADTLMAIGELSRGLERFDRAREAYQAFLAEFPRDDRVIDVRERLAQLPSREGQP